MFISTDKMAKIRQTAPGGNNRINYQQLNEGKRPASFQGKTVPAPRAHSRKAVRPVRRRPGVAALAEIRQMQLSTDPVIPYKPFYSLVKEIILGREKGEEFRVQREAVHALRDAAEAFLSKYFERSNALATHANRVTIMDKDMRLLLRITDELNVHKS